MKNYKKFIERIKALKALWKAEEYFLVTANMDARFSTPGQQPNGPIVYNYMNNTDRETFYLFAHNYIEENMRPKTGKFVCVLNYDFDSGYKISRGQIVNVHNGYIVVDNGSEDKFSLEIPNTELYSHFVFISELTQH